MQSAAAVNEGGGAGAVEGPDRPLAIRWNVAMASSAKRGFVAADHGEVVAGVVDGFGQAHGFELLAGGDSLVQGGEGAAQLAVQAELADNDARED